MMETRTYKNFGVRTAHVETLAVQDKVNGIKPTISIFINDLKNASRAADGHYVLKDPAVVSELRELAVEVSTALAWAGLADNSPDFKATINIIA